MLSNKLYQLNDSNLSQVIASYTGGGDFSSPILIKDGYVYIGNKDDKFYQLNASDVSQVISFYTTGGDILSAPTSSGQYIYFGSADQFLYQVNASDVSQLIASVDLSGTVYNTLLIGNFLYAASNQNKTLYKLNASNISQIISTKYIGYPLKYLLYYNNYIYLISDNSYYGYRIDPSDLSILDSFNIGPDRVGGHPSINEDYLYISAGSKLYQLNATNFSQMVSQYTASSTTRGSVISGDYLYLSSDYDTYILNASNVSQLIDYSPIDGTVPGVIANGFFYLLSNNQKLFKFGRPISEDTVCLWYKNSTESSWKFGCTARNTTYLNGTQQDLDDFPVYWIGNSLKVGLIDKETYFNGSADSLIIWNRTLSSDEIYQLYRYPLIVSSDLTYILCSSSSNGYDFDAQIVSNGSDELDFYATINFSTEGSYSYNISAVDFVNHSTSTENRTVIFDLTAPLLSMSIPENNGLYGNITSITWGEGEHNVTIWANDSAGNVNSTTINFTIDLTSPIISILSPSQNYRTRNTREI